MGYLNFSSKNSGVIVPAKIFLCFLLSCLLTFTTCTTNVTEMPPTIDDNLVVFRIDDGFFPVIGLTADNAHALVHIFFSFEIEFDSEMEDWEKQIRTHMAHNNLVMALSHYADFMFIPNFTIREFINEVRNKGSTLFFDTVTEYIKDNADLANVRLTSARLELFGLQGN